MSCCKTKVKPLKPEDMEDEDSKTLDNGPLKNRVCRDVVFLIIFVLFIGGMGYVTYRGIIQGKPFRLIYGGDSWGNVCNQKNDAIPGVNKNLTGRDMTGKKRQFHFDRNYYLSRVPNTQLAKLLEEDTLSTCISECPSELLSNATEFNSFTTTTGINFCRYDVSSYQSNTDLCPQFPIKNHTSLFNRCVPNDIINIFKTATSEAAKSFTSALGGLSLGGNLTEKIVSDLKTTWQEILIMCGIALGVAVIMVLMMGLLAAVLIWTMVIAVAALSCAAVAYSWYTWYQLKTQFDLLKDYEQNETAEGKVRTWLIYSCIVTAIAVIIMLVLLIMRKRIALVVLLFKEAGKALKSIPFLMLQPLWTTIILLGTVVALATIAVYIETSVWFGGRPNSGTLHAVDLFIGLPKVNNSTGTVKYEMEENWNYLRWYHYFGILWITAFIVACQDMVIIGAVVTWYFNRDKSKLGWPILASIGRLIRYHLGSVAFGSFIIALVRLARLILAYVQRQLKGKVNKVAEFLLKILQCCLWCFERFLAYLNRNAYIEIAIYGYNFCRAGQKAFLVIVANALRVAAINSIGDFVLFLGKICTVAIVFVIGNELLQGKKEDINFYFAPITVACAFAFAISHTFLLVYEIAIDTIFLCVCEDCEMNDGETKPYFMSKDLMKYLNLAKDEQPEEEGKPATKSSKKQAKNTDLSHV